MLKQFIIFLLIVLSFQCYAQSMRLKNLPGTIDSVAENDVMVGDQASTDQTKKIKIDAIRKGLALATTSTKGLFSAYDKKIISKILYQVSGSDTNLTAWGKWNFKGNASFYGDNLFTGVNSFNGPIKIPNATTLNALGYGAISQRELRMEGDTLIFYYNPVTGQSMYLATRAWVLAQNFGTGSGAVDSTILAGYETKILGENELSWGFESGHPILKFNFAGTPYGSELMNIVGYTRVKQMIDSSTIENTGKVDSTVLIGYGQRTLGDMELGWGFESGKPILKFNFKGSPYGDYPTDFVSGERVDQKIDSARSYADPYIFKVSHDSISAGDFGTASFSNQDTTKFISMSGATSAWNYVVMPKLVSVNAVINSNDILFVIPAADGFYVKRKAGGSANLSFTWLRRR